MAGVTSVSSWRWKAERLRTAHTYLGFNLAYSF